MPKTQLTMLNAMAGTNIEQAMDRHVALGLKWLDLKDSLHGQTINDLSDENARRVANGVSERGLKVHTLSSSIGFSDLEDGESAFRARHEATLQAVLRTAQILEPVAVRLLAPKLATPPPSEPAMRVVERRYPWVFAVYREMIGRIRAQGFAVGIENEVDGCVLASPSDVLRFFEKAAPSREAYFIYDVQNLWQMGAFPSLAVYEQLKPLIGGFHLKGGKSGDGEAAQTLVGASGLEDASWPVVDIIRAVVADGVAPVLCLNPSHGKKPTAYNEWEVTQRNIAFLRREIEEIE